MTLLQAINANPVSSTRRVSGELGISQSNVVGHFSLGKSIRSCRFVPQHNIVKLLTFLKSRVEWTL